MLGDSAGINSVGTDVVSGVEHFLELFVGFDVFFGLGGGFGSELIDSRLEDVFRWLVDLGCGSQTS